MSRYIDADAYIKYCDEHWLALNVDAVNAQPTVDAVEVVRCRECKYNLSPNDPHALCANPKLCEPLEQDDYCKYGEKSDAE